MTTSIRHPNHATWLLPFVAWLPLLNRGIVRAGLTGTIVVFPQGVAFATITGIHQQPDKPVCAGCHKRIFNECGPEPTQEAQKISFIQQIRR